ncbi:DUF2252 domain-containing protein [Mycobacterium talmoniae]|uniref:DUF2252 domain-containing protein n=1 Tax=Mycobacterium talmoniae TaxID=1858794 RepID=A0A1S1NNH9_9MYCO|nr:MULTISPECIES: DUF2252 domain-containing protein [Mycobacterium]OHV05677.1 hypothetical protein BKN37_05030 [Mycobacterium talmoniae]PQM45045.1 hypothetical protein C1Y40_04796 [Mycobacterium talmoniae]TDH52711.1 DUF2252 domain-containing protein [Mycobacterium eburneum]
MTVAERHELGRAKRKVLPRSALAAYAPAPDRPDPVALLETQAAARVAELVPIRYARMLVSPYTFFRGAALIMASDLAAGPNTGLAVQLCGDAHASNFGLFASPERRLVFDVNDFDETLAGPWEWDLKRLVASLAIASRSNGFRAGQQETVVRGCAEAYRSQMRELATMGELEMWYAQAVVDDALVDSVDPPLGKEIQRVATKARSRDRLRAVSKLTRVEQGRRRLVSDPPLLVPVDELVGAAMADAYHQQMGELIEAYMHSLSDDRRALAKRYDYVGLARKVVGVGSVGTRAWVVLLLGRDDGDPLLMQVKQAQLSVLEGYLDPSRYPNSGQRVVEGQRLIQAASDTLLGWLHAVGPDGHEGDYYVRQLWDMKGAADVAAMRPKVLAAYGQACGRVLARAHGRTGDRIAIAAYLGKGDAADKALVRFATAYADQNQRDYQALQAAVANGRVNAGEVPAVIGQGVRSIGA